MEIFDDKYVSVSDTFLLPLTGLPKDENHKTYMFWKNYSIEDFFLVLVYEYDDQKKIENYLIDTVFPILDKGGFLLENYDVQGRCILVLDLSVWAFDIGFCLEGKYSKFSEEAKTKIIRHHTTDGEFPPSIYAAFYPNKANKELGNKTPMEIVSEEYGFDLDFLRNVGELGIKYDKMAETLITEVEGIIFE